MKSSFDMNNTHSYDNRKRISVAKKKKKRRKKTKTSSNRSNALPVPHGVAKNGNEYDFDSGIPGTSSRPGTYDSKRIREDARMLSSKIMIRQMRERDELKYERLSYVNKQRQLAAMKRKQTERDWQKKMRTSPFLVDLVAESERVEEENRVRLREELKRQQLLEKRKEKVKGEIILQALAEVSDLESLRQERRNIIIEEKRLKALLDLQKANSVRKQDLLAAQRAEKERRAAAGKYRRAQKLLQLQAAERVEKKLLLEKLDVRSSVSPYGISVGKGVIAPLGGSCG